MFEAQAATQLEDAADVLCGAKQRIAAAARMNPEARDRLSRLSNLTPSIDALIDELNDLAADLRREKEGA